MAWHISQHLRSVAKKGDAGLKQVLATIDSNHSSRLTTYNRESAAHGSEASGLAGLLKVSDRGEIRLGCCGCVSGLDRFLWRLHGLVKAYAQST
jgi:hypothetical protein